MTNDTLKTAEQEGIFTIIINRPASLNALNSQFFIDFNRLLDQIENRPALRVVIISGEGKAFIAGADIAEMAGMDQAAARQFSRTGQQTFQRLENLPIPVIAAVNGFALGGGCELALACDICLASSNAKFAQPEVSLGLTPGYAGSQRLPRLVGATNALHMLLTGEMINAADALRIGLVQKVCEPEHLLEEARALAQKIASRGPQAVRKVKALVRRGLQSGFVDACSQETEQFASLFENEGTEGMRAFLEKRPPQWQTPTAAKSDK